MRISIKRTGGYAGVTEDLASVDTATVHAAAAREVEKIVEESRFFALPANSCGGIGADQFQYEITVTEGQRQHTVTFDDESPESASLHRLRAAVEKIK
jgi:hypothetical protein